ncbi:MAG TPA: UvrB/UvrC motif-containing protein [Gemmatimonadales bacterium]|nr:UvrB/UvrC motif-containing protein [Gemmatimonadales bacterium]
MQCEQCGTREAVVHLTQIAEDQVTVVHLCEKCAADRGFDTGVAASQTPLGGFLATLSSLGELGPSEADTERCPVCGAGFDDFRKTGRLGCAACYTTFSGPLRELMRRLHGAVAHAGERYRSAPSAAGEAPAALPDPVEKLQVQLREAIAAEDFELAARLRDALRGPRD